MMNVPLVPNRRRSMSDPFWAALQPPPNESPADRDRRLFAELEAKRVSDGIDEMLKQEKKEQRMKQEIKVLLLGQSESGKSTTLKREYLAYLTSFPLPLRAHCSDSFFSVYWRAACVRRIRTGLRPRPNIGGREILPFLE
jgi:hypothetical protein